MDTLWLLILQATQAVMSALDTVLAPVNAVHPVLSIMLLALCTLILTRFLRKHIVTKRYLRLQKEFHHWYQVREEALNAHSDPQKAKSLAQNIDKATLNKVYYDYFFEGLLLNLVTTYLPILCVAGYINETFKPERMEQMIGHQSLLVLASPNSVAISPLAWFMLCLVGFWLGKIILTKIQVQIRNRQAGQQAV
ncbi:MAG: EMC3/TMCO1 family protein [Desulfovermiculus sp.]|nr:EMC3/TMCO1 family protein [Desulfovermiculus sp.]